MKLRRAVGLALLVASCIALAGTEPAGVPVQAQAQPAAWGERAPLLLQRSEMSIAVLGGRIFAMGGYPGARITSDAVQIYDAATDSWSLGPPLPRPLHHTMAAVVDGRLYVIGGEAGNPNQAETLGFQDSVIVLDDQAGTWLPRAAMPTARSGGGAGVIDG
jgi:hypothetical protein